MQQEQVLINRLERLGVVTLKIYSDTITVSENQSRSWRLTINWKYILSSAISDCWGATTDWYMMVIFITWIIRGVLSTLGDVLTLKGHGEIIKTSTDTVQRKFGWEGLEDEQKLHRVMPLAWQRQQGGYCRTLIYRYESVLQSATTLLNSFYNYRMN